MVIGRVRRLAEEEEAVAEAAEIAQANLGEEERQVRNTRLQVKLSQLMPGCAKGSTH